MHRALCRVFRGSCRKWRENECPVLSTEEVRKGGQHNNEDFSRPPKYSLTDAIGWTTGIVFAYELTHRKRRGVLIEECPPASVLNRLKNLSSETSTCPFGWPTKAITQPVLSQSVVHVNRSRHTETHKSSIDLTPFIKEDSLSLSDFDSVTGPSAYEDEDSVQFSYNLENVPSLRASTRLETKKTEETQVDKATLAEKLTGDLMSVLGAFKFLSVNPVKQESVDKEPWKDCPNNITEEPPMSAIELMKKGADLGSARALYNIGVAYERLNEIQIAKEYYRKAADLGHPLATYNNAVFLLKEGRMSEGLSMMRLAAENGVPEAQRIVSP